ncbi:MAG: secretin N-terminal domain-containing protein, partial [Halothiobacillaceae bacterium]|nr:secretin N-terminal domain-containing protein [Halothiobacillaceae bacterium]
MSGAAGGTLGAAAGGMGQTGQAQQQTTSVTQLGDKVRVVADDQNNALLIMAPRKDYRKIEHALRQLDIAPTQVLIEASIVEVTLKDNLKYGLEWYLQNGIGSGFTGSPLLNMNKEGTIGAKQPGFSYTISNPAGEIRATLNALAEDSLLKVLSNPSILVLDNNTASIHVGDQQPIKNSTTQTTIGTTESITYKDTGVMLSVTPSVNAGGLINMNIVQAVTDVGEIEVATGQRNFMTRQIRSRVAVRSGESLVLGGLIRDNKTQSQGGVPGLYQIPVLGSLFGT